MKDRTKRILTRNFIELLVQVAIITAAFLLMGCGSDPEVGIATELRQYYDTFLERADEEGVTIELSGDLNMRIANLELNVVGQCKVQGSSRTVTIDENFFYSQRDNHGEFSVEQIVFHELGHCILGRKHNNAWNEIWRSPASVMNQ